MSRNQHKLKEVESMAIKHDRQIGDLKQMIDALAFTQHDFAKKVQLRFAQLQESKV